MVFKWLCDAYLSPTCPPSVPFVVVAVDILVVEVVAVGMLVVGLVAVDMLVVGVVAVGRFVVIAVVGKAGEV